MAKITTLADLIAALYQGFYDELGDEELAVIATAGTLDLMLARRGAGEGAISVETYPGDLGCNLLD